MRAFAALLLVAGPLLAESEVVREEIYNYRIVGTLPAGWKRTSARLSFTYSIDAREGTTTGCGQRSKPGCSPDPKSSETASKVAPIAALASWTALCPT